MINDEYLDIRNNGMLVEHGLLLKLSLIVKDGASEYNYNLFPDGIDLVSIKEPSDNRAGQLYAIFGVSPPADTKDVVLPYHHLPKLMDTWHEAVETLRRMRESKLQ
jgi:hypothetical protein